MKRIHVAAGVIQNADGLILIAKRPDHLHQGGLWEFPGGKLEPGESVEAALKRELTEELSITILNAEPLLVLEHNYSDKLVLLDVWLVDSFDGKPLGNEGQEVRWVRPSDLKSYEFPQANIPILEKLNTL
jgi:8-oxo-dGTP diphosphatase